MYYGYTVKQAFDAANAAYPQCVGFSWGDCMRFDGDTSLKVKPLVKREPDCGDTITGDTWLSRDLSCTGNGLIIGRSGITLDCQGHTFQGSDTGIGIYNTYNDVTIKNCIIRDFDYGIYMHDIADANTLLNNDVLSNDYHGIYINNGWINNLTLNDVNSNGYNGLYLYNYAKYNDIIDNDFEWNGWHGVQIKPGPDGSSDSNNLIDNYLYINGWSGMGINTNNNLISGGWSLYNLYHGFHITSATGNTIQDCYIWYNDNQGIYLYNSTNTQLINNEVARNDQHGVYSSISNYTTIEDSYVGNNYRHGVYLYDSHHNTIQTNYFYRNNNDSIRVYYSDDNFISSNDIELSGDLGLSVWYSNYNTIQFNSFTESEAYALYMYQSDFNGILNNRFDNNYSYSILLQNSDNNEILDNIVNHPNTLGVYSSNSNDLTFENNTVCGSSWDFYTPTTTYTADENTCDSAYQFVDSGQPNACDFKCSGCRRPEDDLYADRDLTFCSGTYNIQDAGSYGIIIAANDGITLTCDGTVLNGVTDTGYGIVVADGYEYVTVQNCELQNYLHGIVVDFDADHNNFINNKITSMASVGMYILRSEYNVVSSNNLTSNGFGVYLYKANHTDIGYNNIELNSYGVYISSSLSYYNYLGNNRICSNPTRDIYNLGTDTLGDLNLCDIAHNYADNGQISDCDFECSGCRKVEDDLVITEDTKLCPYVYNIEDLNSLGVIIIGADLVELDCQGAELIAVSTGSGYGIRNTGYDYVTIGNCKIYNYFIGIDFHSGANYGDIISNDVYSNAAGIRLWTSNYGDIIGNTANLNQYGILLTQNSDANTIRNNVAEVNSAAGITAFADSDFNIIELNYAASNYYGIYITDSDNNYVHNNIVEDNTSTGVYFTSTANNNELHHNRICANSLDINDLDANFGDDNFCTTTSNYDDTGTTGCTFSCLLGDIDVDGDVDVHDLYNFSRAYGSSVGYPAYNPGADLDCDDDVNADSLYIFSENYGKTSAPAPPVELLLKAEESKDSDTAKPAVALPFQHQKENGNSSENPELKGIIPEDLGWAGTEYSDYQTADAINALIEAGYLKNARVAKAVNFLYQTQNEEGGWPSHVGPNYPYEGSDIAAMDHMVTALLRFGEPKNSLVLKRAVDALLKHREDWKEPVDGAAVLCFSDT